MLGSLNMVIVMLYLNQIIYL